MDKKIPIYFDTVILNSPIQEIQNTNQSICRLKVGVFTKYKNRNYSYITDEYAEHLINSAIRGDTPVVGFFDPETQDWASHTGPTLANGYGYVEGFVGWEPFTDTDGVTRDYAVFSVVLFTKYFTEAQKIIGQHQSMELNPDTIQGDWANFDGIEYFVYTKGDMQGLCVIGSHEPCFSVSAFFSKNDEQYKTQYDKFSSLLFDLKARVEEAEKTQNGGEQPMNEFENNQVVEELQMVEEPQIEEQVEPAEEFEKVEEEVSEETEITTEETIDVEALQHNFEELQNNFNTLQNSFNELQTNFDNVSAHAQELEAAQEIANNDIATLRAENEQLHASISNYEAQAAAAEEEKKNNLIKKYEKVIEEEEINPIKEKINNFSYGELESKLAIMFANKQISEEGNIEKVPLPEPQETQFALLMKNYRKN